MQLSNFFEEVTNWAKNERPKEWRYGQAIFNYIDHEYGVAREVQFIDHIDCFYSEDELVINEFINAAWEHLKDKEWIQNK